MPSVSRFLWTWRAQALSEVATPQSGVDGFPSSSVPRYGGTPSAGSPTAKRDLLAAPGGVAPGFQPIYGMRVLPGKLAFISDRENEADAEKHIKYGVIGGVPLVAQAGPQRQNHRAMYT